MYLSVIIPVFNEEKKIARTVRSFHDYLRYQKYDFEIIIVNDGSVDKTVTIINRLKDELPCINLIDNKINKGKGMAVRQGLALGRGEYRLFIDADNATEISNLDQAWPLLENGCEIVIASRSWRDHPGTVQQIKQALWKRIFGLAGNRIIRGLAVKNIWDTQCGFKIFSQNVLEVILPKLQVTRWAFDVEMLVIAQRRGIKIGIIPVIWKNSGLSRVGIGGYFSSFKEVLVIKKNLLRNKYD